MGIARESLFGLPDAHHGLQQAARLTLLQQPTLQLSFRISSSLRSLRTIPSFDLGDLSASSS